MLTLEPGEPCYSISLGKRLGDIRLCLTAQGGSEYLKANGECWTTLKSIVKLVKPWEFH